MPARLTILGLKIFRPGGRFSSPLTEKPSFR